jgi:hypothetical protein
MSCLPIFLLLVEKLPTKFSLFADDANGFVVRAFFFTYASIAPPGMLLACLGDELTLLLVRLARCLLPPSRVRASLKMERANRAERRKTDRMNGGRASGEEVSLVSFSWPAPPVARVHGLGLARVSFRKSGISLNMKLV